MFLGAAGAQLVRKLCLMVRTHVNICGNDKRLKHRTSPSSKTHAVLFEFMRKASAYLIFNGGEGGIRTHGPSQDRQFSRLVP